MFTLMVDATKTLFATHHIQLPLTLEITPEQVRCAINTWLVKTFAREWSIAALGYPPTTFPHSAKDTFESDPDNPGQSPPLPPSPRVPPLPPWGTMWSQIL